MYTVNVISHNQIISGQEGASVLQLLQENGLPIDAPCAGRGTCKKCGIQVLENGRWVLRQACQTRLQKDLTISLPVRTQIQVLESGQDSAFRFCPPVPGYSVAIDIGTTTLVCCLLDRETGRELATASCQNPQSAYGADVISRIQHQLKHPGLPLTQVIRAAIASLIGRVTDASGVSPLEIGLVSVVANPCMEQIFLGMSVQNLAQVPFGPVIRQTDLIPAGEILPICPEAKILVLPEISGYVGADTIGCLLAVPEEFYTKTSLLVDIGTNGEMVLSHGGRLCTCSTAAGPALEGAGIRMGMRGAPGAIDHVREERGQPVIHVIGEEEALGFCGSGLIDAVAFLLDTGIVNARGRIQKDVPGYENRLREVDGDRAFFFTDTVCITQQDIRALQLAKSAIAAGISLMLEHCGIGPGNLDEIFLAGAFGSFLDPERACRIGLLPGIPLSRIHALGNAAGSGARRLARDKNAVDLVASLLESTRFLELSELPGFRHAFAVNMNFSMK